MSFRARKIVRGALEQAGVAGGLDRRLAVRDGELSEDRATVRLHGVQRDEQFTGNVALKTGEGTATLISELLRSALKRTPWSMLGALLARGSLSSLRRRIDPRRVNGGVFLGLNKTVIKSHGGADATGIAAALQLAYQLAQSGFSDKLAARVAHPLSACVGGNVDRPVRCRRARQQPALRVPGQSSQ